MVGGRDRDRTGDPLLAKQVLSQLSYTPTVGVTFILKHLPPFRTRLKQTITFEPFSAPSATITLSSFRIGRSVRPECPAILHHWETLMPLFTVTMKAGRAADEKNAISRAIHEASVKAGYPDDDMFQRFFCLEQADLKVDLNYPGLPKPRSEKMLMIEVLVSSGTDGDRKTRLRAVLVEALDGARH